MRVTVHSPRVCANVVVGVLDGEIVTPFLGVANEWLAEGGSGLHGFNDWEAMTDYDLGGRITVTRWTIAHRARFAGMHFLVASRAVRMGIDIANFALGRFMKIHPERRSFEDALRVELAAKGPARSP